MDGEFRLAENYESKHEGRRISPGGVIDLPLDARLALGFVKSEPRNLKIQVVNDEIRITPAMDKGVIRSSPKGLIKLPSEAHKLLTNGQKGQYDLTINERNHEVLLKPSQALNR